MFIIKIIIQMIKKSIENIEDIPWKKRVHQEALRLRHSLYL